MDTLIRVISCDTRGSLYLGPVIDGRPTSRFSSRGKSFYFYFSSGRNGELCDLSSRGRRLSFGRIDKDNVR